MRSIITFTLCATALLATASPLGDRRALSRKHTGAPLARRFILSSRFDVPAACEAKSVPTSDSGNDTTIPDLSNSTDSNDNSTVTAPSGVDNSTISVDNSTQVDANATTPADNSTDATITKRSASYEYGSFDFEDTWFDLCSNSGGNIFDDSDPCFEYGIEGFGALFADADVCAQQDIADAMITFAKSERVTNSADLIQLAVAYRRFSRESVLLFGFYPSTPYCHRRPINSELNGIWNEQPEGVTAGLFGGPNYPIVPFGEDGTCPYGQFPDATSCSCVSNFFGGHGSATSAAVTADPTSTDLSDAGSSDSVEPTSTDAASVSDAPVETGASSDAASSTDDVASSTDDVASSTDGASSTSTAADATATDPANFNIPNGR